MPSRLTFAVLVLSVLPLSGCNPDEAASFARAARSDLHVKISDEQADRILNQLKHQNPRLTKDQILERFKENAERAGELLDEVGVRVACEAVDYYVENGRWPDTQAGVTLSQRTDGTSVTIVALNAACKAKKLAESGS
jgi:hypothetical protein